MGWNGTPFLDSIKAVLQADRGRSQSALKSVIPCSPPAGGLDTRQARYFRVFMAATAQRHGVMIRVMKMSCRSVGSS
eukprot:8071808-Pyramimonas_sp.AAC.1